MEDIKFTINDIKSMLENNLPNQYWTGKIYDPKISNAKELKIEDFKTKSMHAFIFFNRFNEFFEQDINISNTTFVLYKDTPDPHGSGSNQYKDKDLSKEWCNLLKINKESNTINNI